MRKKLQVKYLCEFLARFDYKSTKSSDEYKVQLKEVYIKMLLGAKVKFKLVFLLLKNQLSM